LYTLYVVGLAWTCVVVRPEILANDTDAPQEPVDAITLTSFVDTSPTPESCSRQGIVKVHSVVPTSAPFIVKAPTKYE
jgi:hypothetical protein